MSPISRWEIWSCPSLLRRLLLDLRGVAQRLGTPYVRVPARVVRFCWRCDFGPAPTLRRLADHRVGP